jgi:hypothetical protein
MVEKVLTSYTEAMDAGAGVEEEAADVDR